jgi:serralysin
MPATIRSTLTGDREIDGLLYEDKWAVSSLSYGFPIFRFQYNDAYAADEEPSDNFETLNAAQRTAVRYIFASISAVANLSFTEKPDSNAGTADLRFGMTDQATTAHAYLPHPHPAGGDSWYNNSGGKFDAAIRGTYGYVGFIHEIGHALGLKHPHEADGGTTMSTAFDAMEFTVMSYHSYVGGPEGYSNETFGYAQTLMMYDIAALQQLYGANYAGRSGDTVYGWSPTTGELSIDGAGQGAAGGNRILLTVWDGGGEDTYDLSAYTTGVVVDLRPGAWSTTASEQIARLGIGQFARGNIANALLFQGDTRSLIENAVGGAGHDSLTGNSAANKLSGGAGDDWLDGGDGDDQLTGGGGADRLAGGAGTDLFLLQDGGDDVADGGPGGDAFVFGAALTAGDQVDGGPDKDQLGLQGNYSLTFGPGNLIGIETLALLSGSDTRFGDPGTHFYSYNLTSVDANVAAGQQLVVNYNGLRPGENVSFDGSAETDGSFFFYGGQGDDVLKGGAGGDAFFFGSDGRFGPAERIQGGAGLDQLGLRGDYAAELVFRPDTIGDVETIALLSAADTRFAAGGTLFSYWLRTDDGNVAAGRRLSVNGAGLAPGETLRFDGSGESDGSFRILAGAGADILTGGAQADFLYGGRGADRLAGGGGADILFYRFVGESIGAGFDQLVGFDAEADRIDLPGAVTGFGGSAAGSLSQASLDADLAAALGGVLGPGLAALFTASAGDMAGRTFVAVDANGVAGYQAGEDYLFEFVAPVAPLPPSAAYFI